MKILRATPVLQRVATVAFTREKEISIFLQVLFVGEGTDIKHLPSHRVVPNTHLSHFCILSPLGSPYIQVSRSHFLLAHLNLFLPFPQLAKDSIIFPAPIQYPLVSKTGWGFANSANLSPQTRYERERQLPRTAHSSFSSSCRQAVLMISAEDKEAANPLPAAEDAPLGP